MTNLTERVNTLTNEIAHLKKVENVVNVVFGSIMVTGLFVACVVCPIMMHLG